MVTLLQFGNSKLSRHLTLLCCVAAGITPIGAWSQSISMRKTASHQIDFSGAIVSITESNRHWPIADHTFILKGANGHFRRLPLHKGGGSAGNDGFNLYFSADDKYFLVSERDCIEFDPVRVKAQFCSERPPCNNGAVTGPKFLGRFDWANGIDPPFGRFQFAFRYLPVEDAVPSGSCSTK